MENLTATLFVNKSPRFFFFLGGGFSYVFWCRLLLSWKLLIHLSDWPSALSCFALKADTAVLPHSINTRASGVGFVTWIQCSLHKEERG